MLCGLCDREILPGDESAHHLVPKATTNGKNSLTTTLHTVCHKQIHALYNEKVLAKYFNTIEKLRNDSNIQRFVKWIRKRPLEFDAKARISNSRR